MMPSRIVITRTHKLVLILWCVLKGKQFLIGDFIYDFESNGFVPSENSFLSIRRLRNKNLLRLGDSNFVLFRLKSARVCDVTFKRVIVVVVVVVVVPAVVRAFVFFYR